MLDPCIQSTIVHGPCTWLVSRLFAYQFAVPLPAKALHQLFGAGMLKYAYLDGEKPQFRTTIATVEDADLGAFRM
jgi:hypothetical protein